MSRLATSFVLGYHGCDKKVGLEAISGKIDLVKSDKAYDWLGTGAYFWEPDPKRALEWAQYKAKKGHYKEAYVIGAVIDLRQCLDLVTAEDRDLLLLAYHSYVKIQKQAGLDIPKNKNAAGTYGADKVLRFLDCAVIRHFHSMTQQESPENQYDTVRGMFTEGGELYAGSGFQNRTHVQIAVRNSECILGLFTPRPYPDL